MELQLTDEQRWLADTVGGMLGDRNDDEAWQALRDFGALPDPSAGPAVGAVELVLIARALGERLVSVPFVDTAAMRFALQAERAQAARDATDLDSADAISLCLLEPGGSWDLPAPVTSIDVGERRGTVRGRKAAFLPSDAGTGLLVLAANGGARSLVLVPARTPGVRTRPSAAALDPALPLMAIQLADVEVAASAVLPPETTEAVLPRLTAVGGLLAAAEAVGAGAEVLQLACEYAGQRRQFGRPIAGFQAIRHLLADMYVRQTTAWSTVLYAAAAVDAGIDGALVTASIAKAYASRATLDVAHGALQVFGGIAFTAEHPAHRYLRRIRVRGQQFGDARHHERRLGRALAAGAQQQEMVA